MVQVRDFAGWSAHSLRTWFVIRFLVTQDLLPPEARAFLDREGRGGVMAPATCANALAHILDTPALAGEVVAVHPDAPGGKSFAVEPLVASAWLGNWRADSRCAVLVV